MASAWSASLNGDLGPELTLPPGPDLGEGSRGSVLSPPQRTPTKPFIFPMQLSAGYCQFGLLSES